MAPMREAAERIFKRDAMDRVSYGREQREALLAMTASGSPPWVSYGLEQREAPAIQQIMDQRRNEHRLAGTREPGNAKPQCGVRQTACAVSQIVDSNQCAVGEGGEGWRQ